MAETHWMHRCLTLASQGRGRTAPNPMVGAIIVRGAEVLAEGWHRGPTAEPVDAPTKLGAVARALPPRAV